MRVQIGAKHISAVAAAAIVAGMRLGDGWRDAATGTWFKVVGVADYPGHTMPNNQHVRQLIIEDNRGRHWIGTDWGTGLIEHLRTYDVDYWRQTLYT